MKCKPSSVVLSDVPSLPGYGVFYPGEETVLPWQSKGYEDCIAGFQMGQVHLRENEHPAIHRKQQLVQTDGLVRSSGLTNAHRCYDTGL